MRVLALDTATEGCSVALRTEKAVYHRFKEVGRGHAELILPMVEQVLKESGVFLERLDGLAASVGPGSFTGVRISVSVAQGLAFGASLPVVAVTTLEALAQRAVRDGATQVLACLDARMGEVYWGCFAADLVRGVVAVTPLCVGPPESVRIPFAGDFQALGRGLAAYPSLRTLPGLQLTPGADNVLPDARDVVSLGVLRLEAGEGIDPQLLAPRYLRDKVAFTEAERRVAQAVAAPGASDA